MIQKRSCKRLKPVRKCWLTTLSLDKEENIADVFYLPLLVCIGGFVLLFIGLVLLRTRTEIRTRRMRALLARERMG